MGIHNVYCNDNAAFRQFVGNTLTAIKQEIANLDGVDEANIKSGVTILGFEGTYTNEDVADAATALDIAEGKVAHVNGKRIVGVAGIEKYTLTIDDTGTGTGTGSVTVDGVAYTTPVDYVAGTNVELVAIPNVGSVFVNWTIDGLEVGVDTTYTYTVSKTAKTVVANFDLE